MRLLLPLVAVLASPLSGQQNWLSEDFDSFPPTGWTTSDNGVGGWTDGSINSSELLIITPMAYHHDYLGQADSRLMSPVMDLSAATGPIWAHWFDYMNRFERMAHATASVGNGSAEFEVSLDGGGTWTSLWTESRTGALGHANHVDLSTYAGEASVTLSWRYQGDDAHWWGIDEVRVDDSEFGIIKTVVNPANGHEYIATYKGKRIWAANAAAAFGGDVVCIADATEDDFVWREFVRWDSLVSASPRFIPRSIWLGASDQAVEGTWVWDDGSPWSYTRWASGEPNNSTATNPNGEDFCRMDVVDGRWLDKDGTIEVFVVIEVDPNPYEISWSGGCPGSGTVTVTGATPNRVVFVLWSFTQANYILPVSLCAGAQLGIVAPNLAMSGGVDVNGVFSAPGSLPANACGVIHVQALDAGTCLATPVLSL